MATFTFNELNFPAVTDNYLFYKIFNDRINPFPANICVFKVVIETLEKCVKYVQSYQLKHQNNVNDFVLVFLFLTLNIFHAIF